MHISAIRSYIVELEGDESEEGLADVFPGETFYSLKTLSVSPKRLRVETILSIPSRAPVVSISIAKIAGCVGWNSI